MKKSILLTFLASFILFSCTKNVSDGPAHTRARGATVVTPQVNVDLFYTASSSTLDMGGNLIWPDYTPTDLTGYTMRFTISGTSGSINSQSSPDLPISASGAGYSTTVSYNSGTTAVTFTVTAQVLYNNAVIASGTQSLTTIPYANASTVPMDSTATITLTRPQPGSSSHQYGLTVSNIEYLDRNPTKQLYLYAFYFPTDDQKINQHMVTQFLGNFTIYGSSLTASQGNFSVYLPDSYNLYNIRYFITRTQYPYSYFQNPLMNVGYTTYLIDQCLNGADLYDIWFKGLNDTNGSGFPWYVKFTIGSLDGMLNTQIYIMKARGFLW